MMEKRNPPASAAEMRRASAAAVLGHAGPSATTVGIEVPNEPPNFSVVLDREGYAWQRLTGSWVRNGAVLGFFGTTGSSATWAELLVERGPVTVLHVPAPRSSA